MRARERKLKRRLARMDPYGYERHPVPANHPTIYLGYGSNMDVVQMQGRCPDSMPVGAGLLHDHKLVFSRVLTVEPCQGSHVPVAIWEVSLSDVAHLDRYEGYPRLYGKRFVHVPLDGKRRLAFYYVMNAPYAVVPPSDHYWKTCRLGYDDFHLDPAPLERARNEARAAAPAPATCQVCGETGIPMAPFELDGWAICRDCASALQLTLGWDQAPAPDDEWDDDSYWNEAAPYEEPIRRAG